ncbi:GNAT family N-acetyltransferase [Candidatus Borrarchaeum sp.]|uniref:GNAT family N-acetyltransferase n=1 Tax=Candidatus Borrarchaeum sp. TaxID=2846742 RepID=UPI00257D6E6E|nr:GNAT family N-acetyltransferase [Candidatus Borrarchaeum sp.]
MSDKKESSKYKTNDIKVRFSTKEDIISLKKMFNKVVKEKQFLPTLQEITIEEVTNGWFDLGNYDLIIVAEIQGELVGQIQLERLEDDAAQHVCEIGIIVDPDYRGKGVGSELLKKTIENAKHLGFEKICLSTFHTNRIAIALYKKFGFREAGRRKKQFKIADEYIDEILFERFLT